MIGAIIGDIVGSRFEFDNHRSKHFELFDKDCFVTDDSIMSLAVCDAILKAKDNYGELDNQAIQSMQEIGRKYPDCGYGASFLRWMFTNNPKPYNSFGNGAAMRVSACGFAATSIDEAIKLSYYVTAISHNHREGLKGAEAVAVAIYLARYGKTKKEIREAIERNYYKIDFKLSEIRESYEFNETCQNTVPQAFEAFFEATDFEDAIRNAISIGGDSDTLAAITGSLAEAFFGVPKNLRNKAINYLNKDLLDILNRFEKKYGSPEPHFKTNEQIAFEHKQIDESILNEMGVLREQAEVTYKREKREFIPAVKLAKLKKDIRKLLSYIEPLDNALEKCSENEEVPISKSTMEAFMNEYYDLSDKYPELLDDYNTTLDIYDLNFHYPTEVNPKDLYLKKALHFFTFCARCRLSKTYDENFLREGFIQALLKRIRELLTADEK